MSLEPAQPEPAPEASASFEEDQFSFTFLRPIRFLRE